MTTKTRIELRLEPEIHASLKALSDESGVSMNRLVESVLAWALPKAHVGFPTVSDRSSMIKTRPGAGVWFGDEGSASGDTLHEGHVFFILDFGASRTVREGWEVSE